MEVPRKKQVTKKGFLAASFLVFRPEDGGSIFL
jgi:hypothetical protein